MKNLILTTFSLMFCLTVAAQTDYYANRNTVTGGNIVYKVTDYNSAYVIENMNNTRADKPLRYLNGTLADPPFFQYDATRIGDHNEIMLQIMNEVFTTSEITAFRNNKKIDILIEIVVIPNGELVEIRIMFDKDPLFNSILPAKWASIEQKMKQRLKYNVSEKGKTVQFISGNIFWSFYHRYK